MSQSKNFKKALKGIANIPCLEPSHEKYVHKIFEDLSGNLTFACAECIFDGIIDEKNYSSSYDIEEFLSYVMNSHSSVKIKEKLMIDELEEESMLEIVKNYLKVESASKSDAFKLLSKDFKAFKGEVVKKLQEVVGFIEKEVYNYVNGRFEKEAMPFKKVNELLNHEEVLCEQISMQKADDLKVFLQNFLKTEKELADSNAYEKQQKKHFDELKLRSRSGDVRYDQYIPDFTGIARFNSLFVDLIFAPRAALEKGLASSLRESFEENQPDLPRGNETGDLTMLLGNAFQSDLQLVSPNPWSFSTFTCFDCVLSGFLCYFEISSSL